MYPLAAILLVDDDPATNYLNEATLYSLRLTNTYWAVKNGVEAIDLLQRHQAQADQPMLVLLDIAMPVMGGMQFLRTFQELPAELRAGIVIVVLATNMASTDLSQLEELPVAGMISKPLTADKLRTILQLHFNANGLGALPIVQ